MLNINHQSRSRRIVFFVTLISAVFAFGVIVLIRSNSQQPIPLPSPPTNADLLAPEQTPTVDVRPYDPAQFGIPDTLAGYNVIAVLSSENTLCRPAGLYTIVVQVSQPTMEEYLASDAQTDLMTELEKLGKIPAEDWTIQTIGPGMEKERILQNMAYMNEQVRIVGCVKFGGPIVIETDTEGEHGR